MSEPTAPDIRIYKQPTYKYYFYVISNNPHSFKLELEKKPSLRWRLFAYLFFGWRIEKIKSVIGGARE